MTYISRSIAYTDIAGNQRIVSDEEFFALDAPLVILGEPGAGKSKLVERWTQVTKSPLFTAATLQLVDSIQEEKLPKRTVIDGIDEVTAYPQVGTPIASVLKKLSNFQTPNFVLACRAADWQDGVNSHIILQYWKKNPIVGTLIPFTENEIIQYVNMYEMDGLKFIREARQRDIIGMMGNPQMLTMFVDVVASGQWPETKSELYAKACLKLHKEHNRFHSSENKNRPSPQKLEEVSGYICASLLFSSMQDVDIDGNSESSGLNVLNLVCDQYDQSLIRPTLSTKNFKAASATSVEPCHRTIAEYLAAKWLASKLTHTLSLRRLETLLYGNNFIIPSSLRGLHAWFTTFLAHRHSVHTELFIKRDPYGLLRYGDVSMLSIDQSKQLLHELTKVADLDPYFRNQDWYLSFGQGLARVELKHDIFEIIRNAATPFDLSHLLIESIQGSSLANEVSDELHAIVLDKSMKQAERRAALNALDECNNMPDWNALVAQLQSYDQLDSFYLALDIVSLQPSYFEGPKIGSIIIGLSEKEQALDAPGVAGVERRLSSRLSMDQLDNALNILASYQVSNNEDRELYRTIENWLIKLMMARFDMQPLPNPASTLHWFSRVRDHSYYRSEWNEFQKRILGNNTKYRQAIQTIAFEYCATIEQLRKVMFDMHHYLPFISLEVEDALIHMNVLLDKEDKPTDWAERWGQFARSIIHRKLSESHPACIEIKKQTEQFPELINQLDEIQQGIQYRKNLNREQQELARENEAERDQTKRDRYEQYEKIRADLQSGKHLQALNHAAKAYLGSSSTNNSNNDTTQPIERLADWVGTENVPYTLEGIANAVSNNAVPSAREIHQLSARKNKNYYIEDILLAYCAIILREQGKITGLMEDLLQSALASFHWYRRYNIEPYGDLQQYLADIVFQDISSKGSYLRNVIEPYLEAETPNVPGLYDFAKSNEFFDIGGDLALEWLEQFSHLSGGPLRTLLIAAVRYSPPSKLRSLIDDRLKHDERLEDEQYGLWIACAFLVDFTHFQEAICEYTAGSKDRLWPIKSFIAPEYLNTDSWPTLSDNQNFFLVLEFGPRWPQCGFPTSWSGDQNPWDAYEFIRGRIQELSANLSDEAHEFMRQLLNSEQLESYQSEIKHLYQQQIRLRAEVSFAPPTFEGVNHILTQGQPLTHADLQAVIIDGLHDLQHQIQNLPEDPYLIFWKDDKPLLENVCRDRLNTLLHPYLNRYSIRSSPESAMTNRKRCDLRCTRERIDVPIEIKGQWHKDIWTAATNQLVDYQNDYHSNGYGIYLVLWFGYLGPKQALNPHGQRTPKILVPKTLEEMLTRLNQCYAGISDKTKIFVLNLEMPD